MATLNDGLVLLRVAEGLADLGPEQISDAAISVLQHLAADPDTIEAVGGRIPDDGDAVAWLDNVVGHARYASARTGDEGADDDYSELVACLAFLGNLVASRATDQATGSFPVLEFA